jgi:hypothetical protein
LDGNAVSCKVQCCDTQNYQARGYYPPSCLGPGSGVGTLAFPRSTCTSVPPPNLRPTFSNRYILTSSRDISTHVVDILWISAVQHQCICMRYPLTCANARGAAGRVRARAFRHEVSPFSGEAGLDPYGRFPSEPRPSRRGRYPGLLVTGWIDAFLDQSGIDHGAIQAISTSRGPQLWLGKTWRNSMVERRTV